LGVGVPWAVQVGECQPPDRIAGPRQARRQRYDRRSAEPEEQQRRRGATDEPVGKVAVIGGGKGQGREGQSAGSHSGEVPRSNSRAHRGNNVAEQAGGGHAARSGQRPQRKRQGNEDAERRR